MVRVSPDIFPDSVFRPECRVEFVAGFVFKREEIPDAERRKKEACVRAERMFLEKEPMPYGPPAGAFFTCTYQEFFYKPAPNFTPLTVDIEGTPHVRTGDETAPVVYAHIDAAYCVPAAITQTWLARA